MIARLTKIKETKRFDQDERMSVMMASIVSIS